ncbi:MAG: MFS transporter [Bradyrhizobium sp.]|nr:MFS transporter [Bradyrhizobium sp.]
MREILSDRRFWKIAPLSGACIGSAWSMQGLWAPAWLTDVEGMTRTEVVMSLCASALVLSLGAWLLGILANWTRRRGSRPETLLAFVAVLFILAQLTLVFRLPLQSVGPWLMIAIVGSATVLSFAIISDYFPKEMAGRANGVLNVVHFGWGFLAQYGTGVLVALWAQQDGHYPAFAYQVAFGANVALQTAALVWFAIPGRKSATEPSDDRLDLVLDGQPETARWYSELPILIDEPMAHGKW